MKPQLILDILYQVLTSPSKAFSEMRNSKLLAWAILTAIFIAVVSALTILPNPPELAEIILGLDKGRLSLAPVMSLWIIIFLAALFIQGGILHFTAILLRGQGSYSGMVCGLCFACFPLVFFAPLAFLRALIESATGNILYSACSLVFFLWIFLLEITAIRQNYHLSIKRAIATYFIPGIILIINPLLILVISMLF